MSDDDPEIPDPIASMDQALASMPDMAKMTFQYYRSLLDAGFGEGQAMVLTVSWQQVVLGSALGQSPS